MPGIGIGICINKPKGSGNIYPSDISGNVLRLLSWEGVTNAGGTASDWEDQSPAGNNATQSNPANEPTYVSSVAAINGKPALRFNGTDQFMAFSNAIVSGSTNRTFFIVSLSNDDASTRVIFCDGKGGTAGSRFEISPQYAVRVTSGSRVFSLSNSADYVISTFELDGTSTSNISSWRNGILMSINSTSAGTINTDSSIAHIGGSDSDGNGVVDRFFNGDIVAIIGYNRALTDTEKNRVIDFLRTELDISIYLRFLSEINDATYLIGCHDVEISSDGNYAYVAGKDGAFGIVDISDPENPSVTGGLTTSMTNCQSVLVLNASTVLVGTNDGIHSVDVSDPANPSINSTVSGVNVSRINGMAKSGNYVLCTNKDGFINVVDVSTPASITSFGNFDASTNGGIDSPHDVEIFGDYCFIVNQFSGGIVKLRAYQFADSGTIRAVGSWRVAGDISNTANMNGANRIEITGDGNTAYIPCNISNTISVCDVSDPDNLSQLNNYSTGTAPNGDSSIDTYYYIAATRTIYIYDPGATSLNELYTVIATQAESTSGNFHDIAISGDILIVTMQLGTAGILIYRII